MALHVYSMNDRIVKGMLEEIDPKLVKWKSKTEVK